MTALKEFANFITLNVANLAATYDGLLVENSVSYSTLSTDSRMAQTRRLIKKVAEACEAGTSDPLKDCFNDRSHFLTPGTDKNLLPSTFIEVECLGQTLTPVVTNLEAGKFLWQILAEIRATNFPVEKSSPVRPSNFFRSDKPETDQPFIEQKVTSGQLRDSEEKYRTLYEALSDAVMLLDEQSFFDCNQATLEIFGCSNKEQFFGHHPSQLSPPYQPNGQDSASLSQQYITTAFEKGPCRFEWRHCRLDGSEFPAEVTLIPIYIEGKKVLQAVVRNLTEQKQMEESLKESEERYSAVVKQAADGVVIIQDNLLKFVNKAIADILGYTAEELVNTSFMDHLAPESKDLVISRVKARLAGENIPSVYEAKLLRKDGKIINTELSGGVIQYLGKSADIGIIRDITERKRLEQKLRESLERRTSQMEISTEIAQQLSNIPSLDDLYRQVVNLVQERLGYYHAQIYTLTEEGMVLQEGTGEAGRRLKEAGHKIALTAEKSLVVRALWSGKPVLIPDVLQEPAWLPNPLLPDTKAELAVPISLGAEAVGVLDVQSDIVGGLSLEDQLLLEGLSGQIAIGIDSRRSYLAEENARRQYHQILDGITDMVLVKGPKSQITWANKAFREYYGMNNEQLQELIDAPFNEPDYTQQYIKDDEYVFTTGQTLNIPQEAVTRYDGEVRLFHTVKSALLNAEGKVVMTVGVSRDITERRQVEVERERLMAEAERRANREQTIREITNKLRAAPNLQQLAIIATRELNERLGGMYTGLELGIKSQTTPENDPQDKIKSN